MHHEDVLRAQPGWAQPRPIDPAYEQALWSAVASHGRLLFRRSPVRVVLHGPDGATASVHQLRAPGAGSVTLTGRAGELLFYAFGRTDHARVEIGGEPQDVTAFQTVHVGL